MMWITNLFLSADGKLLEMIPKEEKEFTERRNYTNVKCAHRPMPGAEFWLHMSGEFPEVANHALRVRLPFAPTPLCENGFSALTSIKKQTAFGSECSRSN
ncbi:hypothetical protein KIL84_009916 [Mauremys mutica]|uniref:SCAN domain-containing protein 3 n=1 Tax=Mauremys mutica TaxID=74926 RepID=A0A9D3XM21_9SAUR|nr:hypothetical protein KIL84_009916 [Mauremys mutica]